METRDRRQPWVTQVRKLLDAPPEDTLKRPYHGMRREELCRLRVRDIQSRPAVLHL
jgi:integrase/recombinase XerD